MSSYRREDFITLDDNHFRDMSPNITGIHEIDHIKSVELVKAAFTFAKKVLSPGGSFVAKIFQGRHTKG